VFWSQHDDPVNGDWCSTAKNDLRDLELNKYILQEIKEMKTYKLKKLVKESIKKWL
jgi:hypothetical protein